jgi:hypothetical protein
MKTIHLDEAKLDLDSAINLARQEPLLLLTADGQEFFLSLADDFEKEVDSLRQSPAFQHFLDERSASPRRIPLDEVETEIDQELAAQEERMIRGSDLPRGEAPHSADRSAESRRSGG